MSGLEKEYIHKVIPSLLICCGIGFIVNTNEYRLDRINNLLVGCKVEIKPLLDPTHQRRRTCRPRRTVEFEASSSVFKKEKRGAKII